MAQETTTTTRQVRLPRTAQSRQDLSFALLIRRIYPKRDMGNAFEGPRLRPGSHVDESELWPAPDFPRTPLLIEYAGSDRSGSGRHKSNHTYLLWQYDSAGKWIELARASAVSTEWVEIIKTAALRYLEDTNPGLAASAEGAAARILTLLESELEPLQIKERQKLLSALWEQLLARLVRDSVPETAA